MSLIRTLPGTVLASVPVVFAGLAAPLANLPIRRPGRRAGVRVRWRRFAVHAVQRRTCVLLVLPLLLAAGAF